MYRKSRSSWSATAAAIAALAALLVTLALADGTVAASSPTPTTSIAAPTPQCTLDTAAYLSVLKPVHRDHFPYISQAAALYDMCSPKRLGLFLGNVAHESAELTIFEQPLTGGRGAIQMIPKNWALAFKDLNDPAVTARLQGNLGRTDAPAQEVMLDAKVMYRIAAWWFKGGAAQLMAPSCATLYSYADRLDVGPGSAQRGDAPTPENAAVLGQATACISGNAADPANVQRNAYVLRAIRALQEGGNVTATATAITATAAAAGPKATAAGATANPSVSSAAATTITMDLIKEYLSAAADRAGGVDPTTIALYAVPAALVAVPTLAVAKLGLDIARAKALERKLTATPAVPGTLPIPYDKEHSHAIWGVGEQFGASSVTRALGSLHARLGPILVWRAAHRISVSIIDPKLAHIVVSKLNLPKGGYESVTDLLGDSLLTANGAAWHHKRKAVNPAFRVSFLQQVLAPAVVDRSKLMFDVLFPKSPEGRAINLMECFSKVTLDLIGLAGFDYDFGFCSASADEGISAMVRNVLEEPNLRGQNPLRKYLRVGAALQYARDLRDFKALGRRVIRDARAKQQAQAKAGVSIDNPTSILGLLLQQSDLGEQELLNEVVTFLFAGHETSASTLAFMVLLLDAHPAAKRALVDEVERELGGRDPTFEDMARLKYTAAVMKETLRLFPIGWATARETFEAKTRIGDYVLPAKTPILVDYFNMHRNPAVWDRPLEFVPERWLTSSTGNDDEQQQGTAAGAPGPGMVPHSYLPFSGGLRSCIGKPFAEMEIKLLTVLLVQRYDWRVQRPAEWGDRAVSDLYADGTTLRPLPHLVWVTPRV
ncbi:hypothetical protein H9P43_005297 [Blastocladiella emersonii ATCC 22665]|nr:hypothetical protein H9P43_005282 [Blastocladiella emersonii ATCC 22665]KAI9179965.1 hypothetical protein H9P43_005297 [Blastocladiella emersonii ATCC 22665]